MDNKCECYTKYFMFLFVIFKEIYTHMKIGSFYLQHNEDNSVDNIL